MKTSSKRITCNASASRNTYTRTQIGLGSQSSGLQGRDAGVSETAGHCRLRNTTTAMWPPAAWCALSETRGRAAATYSSSRAGGRHGGRDIYTYTGWLGGVGWEGPAVTLAENPGEGPDVTVNSLCNYSIDTGAKCQKAKPGLLCSTILNTHPTRTPARRSAVLMYALRGWRSGNVLG